MKKEPLIPFTTAWIGEDERRIVMDSLDASLSGDGFTRRCSEEIAGLLKSPHVLLTTSCTHAIELALMVLDLKPGDEVLLPSFTFVSTANAVVTRGARPVFVEIDEATFNIDPEDLKRKMSPATVGIVPVHYGGVSCDMDAIMETAKENGLWVVEDAAMAFGATYGGRALGTIGDFGCFSFHSTKNIVCGEGGALVTSNEELFHEAEICREKGDQPFGLYGGAR